MNWWQNWTVDIPLNPKKQPNMTKLELFFTHVDKTEDCWLWTGSQDGNGYGQFQPVRREDGRMFHPN